MFRVIRPSSVINHTAITKLTLNIQRLHNRQKTKDNSEQRVRSDSLKILLNEGYVTYLKV